MFRGLITAKLLSEKCNIEHMVGKNMRDKERIDRVLDLLRVLWNKYPDQRLGQLLENYVFFSGERGDKTSVHLFYQEDDVTEKILQSLIKKEETSNGRK